jgi:DNA-binding MarR family transcriptional regulator
VAVGGAVAYGPAVARLTFLEALVLTMFAELPRLTPEDLARELTVDPELMVRLCQGLEAAGLFVQS